METADVVIIGAGIIGAAIAFELSKRGHATLTVDANAGPSLGPTSNSCAIVRSHYSTLEGVAMAYEGFRYWQDWGDYVGVSDEAGTAVYRQCGSATLKSRSGHHLKYLPHYRALGVEFEEWDPGELRRRLPMLDTREFWPPRRPDDPEFWSEPRGELLGAVFTPGSGYVNDPALAGHNLAAAATALGARFRYRARVTAISTRGERVAGVELADGAAISAPIVVNVAGPHSFLINRMAGVEEGMTRRTRALRHEVHHVAAPAAWDLERQGIHVSDGDLGIYFRPDVGNTFLLGSEDPACDAHDWIDDPDEFDRGVTGSQWEAQVYRLARRVPSLGIPGEPRGFADLYDCSDDWIPIYDRSDLPGFYMAVGTSGNQFKNAGVAGRCMAELIEACENGHDHDANPVTVRARYTGVDLDLGMYSRRRAIAPDSSFSVMG
jgi:sarcosine oxidase subunit beta